MAAEEAGVHQQRVEVVDVAAFLEEAGFDRADLAVAREEGIGEGREQGREGELDLRIGVIDRGIDEAGDAASSHQDVASPHIAVDQRRACGLFDPFAEIGGEFFEPAHDLA